jgi:DNA polymerase-3 subunit delta
MASTVDDYTKLRNEVRSGTFRPVYLLHGEEGFFIDRIAHEVERNALAEEERDFNLHILYARDTDPDGLRDACLRYPMMAERQVVVLREAQGWKPEVLAKLDTYLQKPTPTTVLVICHKHKKVDGRKGTIKAVQKGGGAVLTSDKVKEEKLPELFAAFAKTQQRKLGSKEAQLLAAHLGADLGKAVQEIEKLCLVTEQGGSITADAIQRFVGISKDHNVFELQAAIGSRDSLKAQRIAAHFASATKEHPLPMTMGFLNTYFTKLAIVHEHSGARESELASAMGVSPYFVRDYVAHARNYSMAQVVRAQKLLRQYDLRSKGLGGDGADHGELLRELLARIMG